MQNLRFDRLLFLVAILSSMVVTVCVVAPGAVAQAGAMSAQTAPQNDAAGRALVFDVVSIRPIQPSGMPAHGFAIQDRPDGFVASWQTVLQLIQYAYGSAGLTSQDQITGLPDWASSPRGQFYDIEAKMSADDIGEFQKLDKATQRHWREAMMQAMLADRFQLRVHRGTKQVSIYEMVVAKAGAKLKDAATDTGPSRLGMNGDGTTYSGFQFNYKNTVAQELSMQTLASYLSSRQTGVGRTVVNKTGLTGTYNFTLEWSVYPPPKAASGGAGGAEVSDPAPSIFDALKKVGLKLVPAMGTLDTIVVDHVERPSEN